MQLIFNKLKGYTIVELIISMMLTSLVGILALSGLSSATSIDAKKRNTNNLTVQELQICTTFLEDSWLADSVTATKYGCIFHVKSDTISYSIEQHNIVRKTQESRLSQPINLGDFSDNMDVQFIIQSYACNTPQE